MAIFIHQSAAKSQCQKILQFQNVTQCYILISVLISQMIVRVSQIENESAVFNPDF